MPEGWVVSCGAVVHGQWNGTRLHIVGREAVVGESMAARTACGSIDSRMKARLAVDALASAAARRSAAGEQVAGCIVDSDSGRSFGPGSSFAPWALRFAAEERPRPPGLGHPQRAQDRDRDLDRTDLPPPPPPSQTRQIDPDRIRSNHDHTSHSGCPGRGIRGLELIQTLQDQANGLLTNLGGITLRHDDDHLPLGRSGPQPVIPLDLSSGIGVVGECWSGLPVFRLGSWFANSDRRGVVSSSVWLLSVPSLR